MSNSDPARVRILGIRAYTTPTVHIERSCPCTHWASLWKDWLLTALPASARGRIDLDVEISHCGGTEPAVSPAKAADRAELGNGSTGQSAVPSAAGSRMSSHQGADVLDVLAANPESPGILLTEPTDLCGLATLMSSGEDRMRIAACGQVAAAIEGFEPDIVLGYRTGSVLAYEALALVERRVPLLISISSPLAVPRLFSALSPAPTHAQGHWPGRAEHWIDIYDRRDPFAARRPFINHFDGPVADRPVDLAQGIDSPEQAYLSCQTLGAVLEDYFGRRRIDVNLTADLRRVLSAVCTEQSSLYALLSDIGFPTSRLASEFRSADETWGVVMHELSCGVLERGMDQLLEQAQRRYPDNPELGRLRRYCNRPAARY